MIQYKITADGWFTEVNGVPVIRRDMTGLGATDYRKGHPEGILFHYTAGCRADISDTMKARTYPTAVASVGLLGELVQYLPLDVAGFHAYDASHVYWGLEHAALPGTCELNDVQLEASAEWVAAVILETKKRHGFSIPLRRVPGCDITTPGFKEHSDGIGCDWNPKTHTDHLYHWTWDRYLDAVAAALVEEEDMKDFIAGSRARQADEAFDSTKSAEWQFGWRMENRIAMAANLPKPVPAPDEVPEHTHTPGGVKR